MTDTSDNSSSSSVYQPEMSLAQDPGILIYSQHKHLKTLTTAEQQQALKALPQHIQLPLISKLAHVGPIAAIYFENNTWEKFKSDNKNDRNETDVHLPSKMLSSLQVGRQVTFSTVEAIDKLSLT